MKVFVNPYVFEIEMALSQFPRRTSSLCPETYIGGGQSKLQYIGLSVPCLQQTLRKGFSFSTNAPEDLAEIWNQVWFDSNCFEVMSLALTWFCGPKQRTNLVRYWSLLKRWSLKVDNWAHSDTLSGLYARILEENPRTVYPTLVRWNTSTNPWLRRISIVSLIYYSSQRERVLPLNQILNLVRPQLEFDHYYVQKGVGWTLRETHNVYPEKTFTFIENNIKTISSHAFSSATEKMSPTKKQLLKNLRKSLG